MTKDKLTIEKFIINHHLSANSIDTNAVLTSFINEMRVGLTQQSSSLAMQPSFVDIDCKITPNIPIIVLDAGGSNLRVCTVSFTESKKAVIDNYYCHPMPGIAKPLTKKAFYDHICQYLKPVIDLADSISFCFSYPMEISEQRDGKLLYWTKEIKVPSLVGEYIGAGLISALEKRGFVGKKVTLINDTIATLLAGKIFGESRLCSAYVGLILGTGTNSAYVEQNMNLSKPLIRTGGKLDIMTKGCQIINVESGNFSKMSLGIIDQIHDSQTENPGNYLFEKMISGLYLGCLALVAVKRAAHNGLFSLEAKNTIHMLKKFTTADISQLLAEPFNFNIECFDNKLNNDELERFYLICLALVERAAKLTAINIAAMLIKMEVETNSLHPACINIDGSTYYKLHGFKSRCEFYLNDILSPRGIYYIIVNIENSPIIGAAMAGAEHSL